MGLLRYSYEYSTGSQHLSSIMLYERQSRETLEQFCLSNIKEEKDISYRVRPLVKGPARGGGTELLKKGRLLLLLSKALQCWNASK